MGDQKNAVITGFLPSNQVEFNGLQTEVRSSKLLYAGGLAWYLGLLKDSQSLQTEVDDIQEGKIIPSPSPKHSLESIIGKWQCSQTLTGHIKGINCIALKPKIKNSAQSLIASGSRGEINLWD